jgi:hypothetical protein
VGPDFGPLRHFSLLEPVRWVIRRSTQVVGSVVVGDFGHALWGWLFREIRQLCASIFVRRMS